MKKRRKMKMRMRKVFLIWNAERKRSNQKGGQRGKEKRRFERSLI